MPLNDALPARFLCLFNYLVFNLLRKQCDMREKKLKKLIEMNFTISPMALLLHLTSGMTSKTKLLRWLDVLESES